MSIIFSFISKYFLEGLIVFGIGLATKFLSKYMSNDRIEKIKEGILTAMLYAEEHFGIGHGDEKWTIAWRKLTEILQKQGIKLSDKEISLATTMMKATVPKINQLTYSSMPEQAKELHIIERRTSESAKLVEELKKKYPEKNKSAK